jgi:uncharacterized protein (DUF2236 family)
MSVAASIRVALLSDDALLAQSGISPLPPAEEGLFRSDGWLRRINAEPALLFGGGRALLLEIAHPLVAAGVGEHSNFRSDPFGRLQRTLDAMRTIAFGDRAAALAAARGVDRAHGRVHGVLSGDAGRYRAGTPYQGRDPELVRWVWATLVDTALQVYELFVEPLGPFARESYYAEQCGIGRLLGAADVPEDHAAFRAWFDACVAGEALCVTPLAREIADAVLAPAPGLADGGRVRLITAALLPERLRADFGLEYGAAERARFESLLGSVRKLRAGGAVAAESRRRAGDLR